ncbi:MAG: ABC transporter permease [Acidimicrobiales bacterium]
MTAAAVPAPRRRHRLAPLLAQARAEVGLTLSQGENLLVSLGLPLILLVAFTLAPITPTGAGARIQFVAPGILALAVMSTGMVALSIATGFERSYGVLKRLGATPLGRPSLVAAKICSVLAVEAVQVVVIGLVSFGLGWRPHGDPAVAVGAYLLGTVAFAGLGLLMAGTLRAELVLGVANGLYVVLLLLGGMVFSLTVLPGGLQALARALPAAALSTALLHTVGTGGGAPAWSWAVLGAWAVGAPTAAALTFNWE